MRYYTEDHNWVDVAEGEVTVGMTGYGVRELGNILSVKLPTEGDDYIVGDDLATVNGTDIYAPISGTISEVNEELNMNPGLLGSSPENKGWLCRFKDFDISELDDMMTAEAYDKYLESGS